MKKSPYPFEKIAVAVAFSPRLEALVLESARLQKEFGAQLYFIHVGEFTPKSEKKLRQAIDKAKLDESTYTLEIRQGEPVDVILGYCKENMVDLLVAGALEKENIFKYYIGSIARKIIRRAKCSVLMLTEPTLNPKPFKKVVVNGIDHPKTSHTIGTAVYLAKEEHVEEIHIVKESRMYGFALMMAEDSTEQEAKSFRRSFLEEEIKSINQTLAALDTQTLNVKTCVLTGKPGYEISNYARTKNADLLIVNSPDSQHGIIDRVFPHDIEYALADLPCSLLTIHSRP